MIIKEELTFEIKTKKEAIEELGKSIENPQLWVDEYKGVIFKLSGFESCMADQFFYETYSPVAICKEMDVKEVLEIWKEKISRLRFGTTSGPYKFEYTINGTAVATAVLGSKPQIK